MRISTLLLTSVCLASAVSAALVRVPSDYPTIQAGIDAAPARDTVLVASGIYQGAGNRDLKLGGKFLYLLSEEGAAKTIIDCQGTASEPHQGIIFAGDPDSNVVIEGFTIRNAYSDSGAVRCKTKSLFLRDCVITQNTGIGVRTSLGAEIDILNCTISENTKYGIYNDYATAYITGCDITANGMTGILAWNNSTTSLSNSLIRNNGDVGLDAWLFGGSFHVANCTFVGNGTGLFYDYDFPKQGAAAPLLDTSSITNSIFAFNRGYGIRNLYDTRYHNVACNDAYGNPLGNFFNTPFGSNDVNFNFSANPFFCDTAQADYHISSLSLCSPAYSLCQSLIGRDSVGCTLPYLCGDVNNDGRVNIGDIIYMINFEFKGGPRPNPMISFDVNGDMKYGVGDIVYLIIYIFQVGPNPNCP